MPANDCLGHTTTFDDKGNVVVEEVLVCAHCQHIYKKPGPKDPAGFCHMCFKPVCLACGAKDKCDPFEKKLERMEARARLLRSV